MRNVRHLKMTFLALFANRSYKNTGCPGQKYTHVLFNIFYTKHQINKKWGIIQFPRKWHNRITMSSDIPSLCCLSAVFGINDPVLALLRRATFVRQTLFGICNVLFRHLCRTKLPGSLTLIFFNSDILGSPCRCVLREVQTIEVKGSDAGWERNTHDRAFSSWYAVHGSFPCSHSSELETVGSRNPSY